MGSNGAAAAQQQTLCVLHTLWNVIEYAGHLAPGDERPRKILSILDYLLQSIDASEALGSLEYREYRPAKLLGIPEYPQAQSIECRESRCCGVSA